MAIMAPGPSVLAVTIHKLYPHSIVQIGDERIRISDHFARDTRAVIRQRIENGPKHHLSVLVVEVMERKASDNEIEATRNCIDPAHSEEIGPNPNQHKCSR